VNAVQTTTLTATNNWSSGDSSGRARMMAHAYPTASSPVPNGTRLAVVQVYSRILSAADVAQNFNAYRGRFGL
jgi:hypothetical protein